MTSMFRSEEMTLCQLFLQSESAYACVSELGELGLVEFRDFKYLIEFLWVKKPQVQIQVNSSWLTMKNFDKELNVLLNPDVNAFQRKFVNEVRRCDEMERKLRFMQKEIDKAEISIVDTGENPDAPHPREMIDLEAQFEQLENEMKDSNSNYEALQKSLLELLELRHILQKTQSFFEEAEHHVLQEQIGDMTQTNVEEMSLLGDTDQGPSAALGGRLGPKEGFNDTVFQCFKDELKHCNPDMAMDLQLVPEDQAETRARLQADSEAGSTVGGQLGFVAGVINRERIPAFERLLWRACRGNVFFKQAEIVTALYDPGTGDLTNKCVFIVFFQGEQLKIRVKKICEGFRATLYPCPETPNERREMVIGVNTRIEDLQTVISQTQEHRHRLLQTIAKNIHVWLVKVKKIKAIYHTMNMFNLDVTQKCLIAECWAPVADLDSIRLGLRRGTERSGAQVSSILNRMTTKQEPPTFNRTNKFTRGFQAIIDAYGVASYQEVNPALYTIITFPFLFSVMFGDCGHGLIVALFALYLIMKERKLANWKAGGEMFDTIFHGRYIIFLMGLFSIYSGLLYNDMFSKSLNIFGSGWVDIRNHSKFEYHSGNLTSKIVPEETREFMLDPKDAARPTPYYFGLDPVWQLASNKLTFTNSLKMKLSVIFGVSHMIFGVVLSLFNHLHFKKPVNIFCEFIPQLLFISCIFGYLVILIFYKWIAYSINSKYLPSILIGLLNMFLKFGNGIPDQADRLYNGQGVIEPILVIVAVLCVPWMLLIKPFYLRRQHRRRMRLTGQNGGKFNRLVEDDISPLTENEVTHHDDSAVSSKHDDEEHFAFGEVFIHQCIHTIEYCLGCISNTASYLRLWALSLAHAQLSEVIWDMVFKIGLGQASYFGGVVIYFIWAAWAVLSVAILLVMEGLSAFLHTLRLHWVEFNSKFYVGAGSKFAPFSFKEILAEES